MLLVDCGRASKVTLGQINQLWYESGFAPFNKNACYIPVGPKPPVCEEGGEPIDPALDLSAFKAGIEE